MVVLRMLVDVLADLNVVGLVLISNLGNLQECIHMHARLV